MMDIALHATLTAARIAINKDDAKALLEVSDRLQGFCQHLSDEEVDNSGTNPVGFGPNRKEHNG